MSNGIDEIVQLSFEGGEVVLNGKPEVPDKFKRGYLKGMDYCLGFVLRGTDEAGKEEYYAGFCTAVIEEYGEGRSSFSPVYVRGLDSWRLYVGAADSMRKASVHSFQPNNHTGTTGIAFELGGENYELVVPHSRGKPAVVFPHAKPRIALEPILTVFEAQGRAITAYRAAKAAQETGRG